MDKTESLQIAKQVLSDYLRLNSLRNTQERVALLEAIYSADAPFAAEELSMQMTGFKHLRISRATVYNNLGLFEDAGLVRKVFLNDKVLYERTDRNRHVIRLVCGGCGKSVEINDERVRRQIEDMRTRRFTMTGWSLNVYGVCSKCSAALKRKMNKLNKIQKKKNEDRKD